MSATAKSPGAAARPSTGWNSACASRIRSMTLATSSSVGSTSTSSTRDAAIVARVDRGLEVQARREPDRTGRLPVQVLDLGPPEDGELALLDRRGHGVGQEVLEDVALDLLGEALRDHRLGGLALPEPGQGGLAGVGPADLRERLFDFLGRDLDLEDRAGRSVFLGGENRHRAASLSRSGRSAPGRASLRGVRGRPGAAGRVPARKVGDDALVREGKRRGDVETAPAEDRVGDVASPAKPAAARCPRSDGTAAALQELLGLIDAARRAAGAADQSSAIAPATCGEAPDVPPKIV